MKIPYFCIVKQKVAANMLFWSDKLVFSILGVNNGSTAEIAGAPVFCTKKNFKKNIDLPPNGMEYIQRREKEYRDTVSTVLYKLLRE